MTTPVAGRRVAGTRETVSQMNAWLWWVGGATLLAIAEILSLDLILLMLAAGALAGAGAALLGADVAVQIITAIVASVLLLFALRPWLLRHLRQRTPLVETNAAALVGRPAIVVATTTELGGRVKLAGEVWSARTAAEDVTYPPGAEVRVTSIDGATAVVALAEPA
ncbi:membrane protein [Cellulomonas cellasea]|uniref:Membrane protein n=2 Tax=Cellulomonas cellasea TaxID=43670 RepID=A0A4Y3L1E6_9CELL|nr:membrane protein [Cellulomonas cellasea]